MEKASDILKRLEGQGTTEIVVSQRNLRRIESIEMARLADAPRPQQLVYSSRPFVLCGLPVKRPAKGILLHERRNGKFNLQITGHPKFGLPFGQDRLIPIWVATLALRQKDRFITFKSAAEILDTFGPQGRQNLPPLGQWISTHLWSHYLFRNQRGTRPGFHVRGSPVSLL